MPSENLRDRILRRWKTRRRRAERVARLAAENLESRRMLDGDPFVFTDKPDYAPGDLALFTAGGFWPGEAVEFKVSSDWSGPGQSPFLVTDGVAGGGSADLDASVDGSVTAAWLVDPEGAYVAAKLRVDAVGTSSGAHAFAWFTDGDTKGPRTSDLVVTPPRGFVVPTITARIDDGSGNGNSDVVAAEYFLFAPGTSGSGTALAPADGRFNSSREDVVGTLDANRFSALPNGEFTIWVHGRDEYGNWGAFASTTSVKATSGSEGSSQSVTTDEDVPTVITLVGSVGDDDDDEHEHDDEHEGDSPTYAIVSAPAHGSLSGSGATRTFTPDADFAGADAFTYRVRNGEDSSELRTVSLTVRPVNDAPRIGAFDADVSVLKNATRTIAIPVTDVDSTSWTFSLTKGAPSWAAIDPVSGVLTLAPDLDARSSSFAVIVRDAEGATASRDVVVGISSVGVQDGNLMVYGTTGADLVTTTTTGATEVAIDGVVQSILLEDGTTATAYDVLLSGGFIVIDLGNGANRAISDGPAPVIYLGGNGADDVTGGEGADIIAAGNGADRIDGRGGNDILLGGRGDDTISGRAGDDAVVGGLVAEATWRALAAGAGVAQPLVDLILRRRDVVGSDEGGTDTLVETADTDFSLADASLSGLGSDTLSSIEVARLTGGVGDNRFTLGGWTGSGQLDGAGGRDTVIVAKQGGPITLADASVATSDGLSVGLAGIAAASLVGGADGIVFDVTGFRGSLSIATGGAPLNIVRVLPESPVGDTLVLGGSLARLEVESGAIHLGTEIEVTDGGLVSLVSSGAIVDGNDPEGVATDDIVAGSLILVASGGIGDGNDLETRVATLSASNDASGDVSVVNRQRPPAALLVPGISNTGGSVRVENFGDETHGITVAGKVVARNGVSFVSHSPLTIDSTISSLDGGSVTLQADTIKFGSTGKVQTTGDFALDSSSTDMANADLGSSRLAFNRDGSAVDLTGATFGSLLNGGAATTISLAGANFTSLTNTAAATISLAGATFSSLLNQGSSAQISLAGANFSSLTNTAAATISLAGATFSSLLNSAASTQISLSGATFSSLINSGASTTISLAGANFTSLTNEAKSAVISLDGATFSSLLNSGATTQISLAGATFNSLLNQSASTQISLDGASFSSLINTGTATTISLSGGKFDSLLNGADATTISLAGATFNSLLNQGATTQISLDGANFTSLTNEAKSAVISLDGATFSSLLNQGATSQISLSGGKFDSLLNGADATTISLAGATFNSLLNQSASTQISLDGASFSSLINTGTATTISLSGGKFDSLLNGADATTISLAGATFNSLLNQGATTQISLAGANFTSLTNEAKSAVISLDGATFSSLLNQGATTQISLSGGKFDSLLNGADATTISLAGATFNSLLNQSASTKISLDGASFSSLINTGTATTISLSGGKFDSLLNGADATTISLAGATFNSLLNQGAATQISLSGASFTSLTNEAKSAVISLAGATFSSLLNQGTSTQISLSGGKFDSLLNGADATTISLAGATFNSLLNQGTATQISLDGASFSSLINTGTATTISLSGGKFDSLLNGADATTISLSGATFHSLLNQGTSTQISLSGASFSSLVNTGSATQISLSGATFSSLVNTGSATTISLSGGKFDSLLNGADATTILLSGATFSSLLNQGASTQISLSGASFSSLVNTGSATTISLSGADFDTLDNSGNDTSIGVATSSFVAVSSSGGGVNGRIVVTGSDFSTLENTGNGISLLSISSSSFEFVRNEGDLVSLVQVVGDDRPNVLVNDGDGVNISFLGGGGDDVFVNDARGDDAHGNDVALAVDLGAGADRLVIRGLRLAGSIGGGGGDDTYSFVSLVTGALGLSESGGVDTDTLDFSPIAISDAAGVRIDLATTAAQTVAPGLSITLSSASGIENVVGSGGADAILGNDRNNVLSGADEADDRIGTGAPWNGRTQVVYLDFDSATDPGEHVYTADERSAIVARLNASYAGFRVVFRTDLVDIGEHATITFNEPRPDGMPGGDASEIDFGNRNLGGTATVQVNGLLGLAGGPPATSANVVAASSWVAAHELAHLMGTRHADSFGPIGFGVAAPPGASGMFISPAYPGAAAAYETDFHLIATPALTGFSLDDLVDDTFFGEREAVKLAYAQSAPVTPDGRLLVAEQSAAHDALTPAGAQAITPVALDVPNTLRRGLNAGKQFVVGAVDVIGAISVAGQSDVYRFDARRGDLLEMQVMSKALARYEGSAIDAVLTVYDASGREILSSDDEFESQDPSVIDFRAPADGTYYIRVRSYSPTETGNYELFLWRFDTANRTDGGDVIEGRGGDDLLSGGIGSDTYVFAGSGLGRDVVREDARLQKSGVGVSNSTDGRDARDTLDFRRFAAAVTLDLASPSWQVVDPKSLSLRLSAAVSPSDEPTVASGIEDVLGSPLADVVFGNARANTIDGGAGNDIIFGGLGDDFLTGAEGDDLLVGGAGNDRLVGSAGNDILVAGEFRGNHDGGCDDRKDSWRDIALLRLIVATWSAKRSRDADMKDGDDDFIDTGRDQLTGGAGADWFIVGINDTITDASSKQGDVVQRED